MMRAIAQQQLAKAGACVPTHNFVAKVMNNHAMVPQPSGNKTNIKSTADASVHIKM